MDFRVDTAKTRPGRSSMHLDRWLALVWRLEGVVSCWIFIKKRLNTFKKHISNIEETQTWSNMYIYICIHTIYVYIYIYIYYYIGIITKFIESIHIFHRDSSKNGMVLISQLFFATWTWDRSNVPYSSFPGGEGLLPRPTVNQALSSWRKWTRKLLELFFHIFQVLKYHTSLQVRGVKIYTTSIEDFSSTRGYQQWR